MSIIGKMRPSTTTTARASLLAATSLFTLAAGASIDPIVINGAKFFHQNSGDQL